MPYIPGFLNAAALVFGCAGTGELKGGETEAVPAEGKEG